MSPQPQKTTVVRSFQDLDPDMFAAGEPPATSADGQVIDMTSRVPRAKSEIEDPGAFTEAPESTDTEPETEATDAASTDDGAEEPQTPKRRILVKDLCQDLVAAGTETDESTALLRIREWYTQNIEGGADKVIVPATTARKELRDAVATWIAAGSTEVSNAGDGAAASDPELTSDEPLTVEAAKEKLMDFITMARTYGEVQELADEIYMLGMKLGVPAERLFRVRRGDNDYYSPSREDLEATPALIRKTWYYGAAFWMSKEEREPEEFLKDWYWPGTKPQPVRSREPRSQEPSLPQLPPVAVSLPASTSSAADTPPDEVATREESGAAEALDSSRQFRVHGTGALLTREDGESNRAWRKRTQDAVKAARKAAQAAEPASGDVTPEPVESPFSTESATPAPAPIKKVSSVPGAGTRIVRTDGTTEDKPYDWAKEEGQGADAPEGSDASDAQTPDAESISAVGELADDSHVDAQPNGDQPTGEASGAVDDSSPATPVSVDTTTPQVVEGPDERLYRDAVEYYRQNPTASVAEVLAAVS